MAEKRVEVEYLTRVEGEGSLHITIEGDQVKELYINVFESPRLFEAFMVGRRFDEVHRIASRICGICCVAHQITALRAIEKALGVEVSEQTKKLRELLALSGLIQSHALHFFFLGLPDLVGHESLISMASEYPDVAKYGLSLKKVGNDLTELLGGRPTHPVTTVVGGFTKLPKQQSLQEFKKVLEEAKGYLEKTAEFVSKLEIPQFSRRCEHVALWAENRYAVNEGRLRSTEGLDISEDDYPANIEEWHEVHSNAKHTRVVGRSELLVGPLARVNISFDELSPFAKEIANTLGFKPVDYNPHSQHLARVIELAQFIDQSIEIIDELELRDEKPIKPEPRAGEGIAVTEAPRGILYHHYRLNRMGFVEWANVTTPTVHNVHAAEKDLLQLVPKIADKPVEEIRRVCEELIRTYDFCLSCSVHLTKLP